MSRATPGANHGGMSDTRPGAGYRVSTAEREPVIERLKAAYAVGRLGHDELDERLQRAMTVRTAGELTAVTADLVSRPVTRPRPRPRPVTVEERMLGAGAHATGMVPIVIFPLLIMLTYGRRSPFVRHQAAEALNFQLSLLMLTIVTFGLGAIVYAVAWVVALVGAVCALGGELFRYPWIVRVAGHRRGRG